MGISIFIHTHVCTISKDISKVKDISLPEKESISGHRYERTDMAAKLKCLCYVAIMEFCCRITLYDITVT